MKTIHAEPITAENWAPYGYLANIANPDGAYALGGEPVAFHRDMALAPMASAAPAAFGSLKVGKRPMVIEDVEYHSFTVEVMMPMDDDMVIYAGPANSGTPEPEKLKAFVVPAGMLVVFRAGVWHGAPYPVDCDGTVLICLPERTYLNDTKKVLLEPADRIAVEI
ncbi:ureidoglycolate lyase [Caproicibacter sp.]|uniref:ureidoglycolate lyase n=1 Tax=Caproicibacter sp. TaxID=2814884 RepID=UPI003989C377